MITQSHAEQLGLVVAAAVAAVGVLAGGQLLASPAAMTISLALCALAAMHGATDYLVARRQLTEHRSQAVYLVSYVLLAILTTLALLQLPMLALPVLLVLSALHFGAHIGVPPAPLAMRIWFQFSFGATPILAAMLLNTAASESLFAVFVGTAAPQLTNAAWYVAPIAVVGVITWAALSLHGFLLVRTSEEAPSPSDWTAWWRALVHVVLACCLFLALPLMPAFCAYFALLHAPSHGSVLLQENPDSRQRAWREAAGFTLWGALLLVPPLWFALPRSADLLSAIVLAALLALAVPHALNSHLIRALGRS